jgi:ribose transport system ATP-binding protein
VPVALRLTGISKRYPGVQALREVSFECLAGEVHAVVGENGSGKSTLLGIASGATSPDAGTVEILGQTLSSAHPALARKLGLAVVYQDHSLIGELTCAENLYLSARAKDRPRYADRDLWAERQLQRYGIAMDARSQVRDLSLAKKQFLEVIKALASHPKILLLDEPTTALGPAEVAELSTLVRHAAAEGAAVVYVSHRLPEILALADRLTVLRDGEGRGTYATEHLVEKDIVTLMVGVPVELEFPARPERPRQEVVLEVDGLEAPRLGPLSFRLHQGEVLGIAGAEGNGQGELLRALVGLVPAKGSIVSRGRRILPGGPRHALEHGIMLLSGDRRGESIFADLGVGENMTVQVLERFAHGGVVMAGRERAAVSSLAERLRIVTPSLEQPIKLLSGGNQQKAVLARSFLVPAQAVVIDEPTQGVDAKARLDIYQALAKKAEEGAGILIKSSDASELCGLCDRVLVLSRGKIVRELSRGELTEENVVASFLTSDVHHEERPQGPPTGTRASRVASWLPLGLLVLLTFSLGTYAALHSDAFLSPINARHFLTNLIPVALVAMAQLQVLLVGGFDVSVGSTMSLAVVLSSFLLVPGASPLALALGAGAVLALGAGVGTTNALLVRGFRIPPIIATIASLSVVQGIALILRPVPEGLLHREVTRILLKSRIGFVPYAMLGVLVLAAIVDLWLQRTSGGLRLRSTGFREDAARKNGVSTGWLHVRAYVLSGLLAALAGLFLASQVGVGAPTVGEGFALESFAACVLGGASLTGGRGSCLGALVGALLLTLTVNVVPFLGLNTAFGIMMSGGLTLLAILLYSGQGTWGRIKEALRRRAR